MFKHLLVPLDGSQMAEAGIPPAVELARGEGVKVTLIVQLAPAATELPQVLL